MVGVSSYKGLDYRNYISCTVLGVSTGLPDFIGAPYEFWVGANAEVGTSVGQIRISDFPDRGKIIYDLLHGYSEGGM